MFCFSPWLHPAGSRWGNWQRPFVPVAAIPVPRSLEDGSGYPHRLDRSMVSNNHGLTSWHSKVQDDLWQKNKCVVFQWWPLCCPIMKICYFSSVDCTTIQLIMIFFWQWTLSNILHDNLRKCFTGMYCSATLFPGIWTAGYAEDCDILWPISPWWMRRCILFL